MKSKIFGRFTKRPYVFLCLFFLPFLLNACEGGECAATDSPLTDADSDCIEDGGDNCPLIYNPEQFDGDEDGVGVPCDSDDTDDTVGSALVTGMELGLVNDIASQTPYVLPQGLALTSQQNSWRTPRSDSYYLMGCNSHYLGELSDDWNATLSISNPFSPYGDGESDVSILNDFSFYGRPATSCSAFNPEALYPPVIYRRQDNEEDKAVGYLTLNPFIVGGFNTCEVLNTLEIEIETCL
jgi:hypothetical protein